MGIACMVRCGGSAPAGLVQAADALLYQAEAGGRNRCRAGVA